MWYRVNDETIDLWVSIRPSGGKDAIIGVYDNTLKIKVTAAAVEGAANRALVKFLSKQFRVPKSEIVIVSGETAKKKHLRIKKNDKILQFIAKI